APRARFVVGRSAFGQQLWSTVLSAVYQATPQKQPSAGPSGHAPAGSRTWIYRLGGAQGRQADCPNPQCLPALCVNTVGAPIRRNLGTFGCVWAADRGSLKRSTQQGLHLLSWRTPLERFSRAAVELGGDLVKLDLAARTQVELARQVLTEQPVGVLVGSTLPRRVGIAEVDLDAGVAAEALVRCEL